MVILGSNLYGSFTGSGIWKWNGTTWTQVTPNNPDLMVTSSSAGSVATGTNPVSVCVQGNYAYVVNRDISATARLWIHDDHRALEYAHRARAHVVVGPNLYVMPHDVPSHVRLDGMLYILPGPTSAGYWRTLGFDRCELAWWPVGIDTDECAPSDAPPA